MSKQVPALFKPKFGVEERKYTTQTKIGFMLASDYKRRLGYSQATIFTSPVEAKSANPNDEIIQVEIKGTV